MGKKVVSSGKGMIAKATTKYAGKSMAGVMPLPGGGKGKCDYAPKIQKLD